MSRHYILALSTYTARCVAKRYGWSVIPTDGTPALLVFMRRDGTVVQYMPSRDALFNQDLIGSTVYICSDIIFSEADIKRLHERGGVMRAEYTNR